MPSQAEPRHVKALYPAAVKAIGDPEQGQFEAVVSIFGNVDRIGDRVVKGAFSKSIGNWQTKAASGKYLPIYYSHQYGDPAFLLGKGLEMSETDEGLVVRGQLFMGKQAARDVYEGFKEGVLDQFSFAYDVVRESKASDGANELLELEIIEAGPTPIGMNSLTRLLEVKAEAGEKAAGRMLSKKDERDLAKAVALIQAVLEQGQQDEAKAEEPPEVKTATVEEPSEVKAKELDPVDEAFRSELRVGFAL